MSASMKMNSRKRNLVAKPEKNVDLETSRTQSYPSPIPQWTPAGFTAFKLLLSARLCAALWNIVGDCDETFNYWEPMHYLLFKKGFQTWEYSPVYAIRSYAYLWIHAFPLAIYNHFFGANKILLFYYLRCILAFCCAISEIYFYKGVCKHFGANTGRIVLCFLLLSAGMFNSCTAFLPSTFCMYMTLVSIGGWLLGNHKVAILATASSTIIGWPFAGVLGMPIAFDIVFRRKRLKVFIIWCIISLLVFLGPLIWIDYQYYGKLVIAPLNIVIYNVFTDHGPDLYGVEPFSYYLINGFLNFNVIFPLALGCLPLVMFVSWILKIKGKATDVPVWLVVAPMYIWIAIFFTRPHKEERFLFPIYPMFVLCGAISLDHIQKLWSRLFPSKSSYHYTDNTNWISVTTGVIYALLSLSRIIAMYQGYHAPLDTYVELNKFASDPKIHTLSTDKHVNVCVGKEWYRFPSNFFLPGDNWNLQFIRSEFKGQLPKPYSSHHDATKLIPTDMNDKNKEEISRYISNNKCHYLIDLDLPIETELEPRYSKKTDEWKILSSYKFLDSSRFTFMSVFNCEFEIYLVQCKDPHGNSWNLFLTLDNLQCVPRALLLSKFRRSHRLFRAFYIPFVSNMYCTYVDYNLMKSTRTKKKVQHKVDD